MAKIGHRVDNQIQWLGISWGPLPALANDVSTFVYGKRVFHTVKTSCAGLEISLKREVDVLQGIRPDGGRMRVIAMGYQSPCAELREP